MNDPIVIPIPHRLTKRELFAMFAMQGLLANGTEGTVHVAYVSVLFADALIKELADEGERA